MANAGGERGASSKSKMFSVYVRFRPLNERERREHGETCIEQVMSDDQTVVVNGVGSGNFGGALAFKFDRIFYEDAGQNRIFEECVLGRLETFIASTQDCNVLSYGQTSSGKTWTIDGTFYRGGGGAGCDATTMGIMPRTLERLCSHYGRDMTVACYEIYCEKIFDLLRPSERACKFSEVNDTIAIDVAREQCPPDAECSAYEYYARLLRRANKNRHFASTAMNSVSSRSHTFIEFVCPTKCAAAGVPGKRSARPKIFRIIDLAGSERAAKTLAKDQVLQEGININNSLMYLKQMVEIISQRSIKSLPKYRDSKLTRIIYSSIKNNDSSVVLLLCCSPSNTNASETINTLRFGSTATKITKLTTLTRDEATTAPASVVYANGISPLESENRVRAERERNLLELQRLERKLHEERDQERREFEQRISAYERQIRQLTASDAMTESAADHVPQNHNATTAPSRHGDEETPTGNDDEQLAILRVTKETYAQCRDTIELQRKIIDELMREKQRLNEQVRVYDLFKTYMLANIDTADELVDSEREEDGGDESEEEREFVPAAGYASSSSSSVSDGYASDEAHTYENTAMRANDSDDFVNLGTILGRL